MINGMEESFSSIKMVRKVSACTLMGKKKEKHSIQRQMEKLGLKPTKMESV
jgi:hypothetical protein